MTKTIKKLSLNNTKLLLFIMKTTFVLCEVWAESSAYNLDQWWANYGPRARCGPLRGSIRPVADFKI